MKFVEKMIWRLKKVMDKRNSGFSMVEIIIVIGVMGILSTSAFSMINYLKYADIQSTVKEIESQINKLQVSSMSKQTKEEIYIYKIDGDYYMKIGVKGSALDKKGIKLGNSSMTIKGVKKVAGTDESGNDIVVESEFALNATESGCIKIAYLRSGVFSTATNVDKIVVSGKTKQYMISLFHNTGRVRVD